RLRPETKKSIWAIGFVGLAIILTLAGFEKAGPAGEMTYQGLEALVGIGYFILPLSAFLVAGVLLISERQRVVGVTALGAGLIIFAALGLIDIARPRSGGWLGLALGSLKIPFGNAAAVVLNIIILTIAALVTVNAPLRLPRFAFKNKDEGDAEPVVTGEGKTEKETKADEKEKRDKEGEGAEDEAPEISIALPTLLGGRGKKGPAPKFENYVAPPLDLLKSSVEKPTTGDLRANANIIKRTLEGFGIPVEMGEVNIGPKVTRYTLKPAEGMKLSRIVALHQDLALALAAHPIRIEAPIPGKSLVGIEVPNKAAAVVRLGSLMAYPEFHASGPLGF
ncbi:MAG: DNA translocase FtsK, partial [Patescibacteria group bacterium]